MARTPTGGVLRRRLLKGAAAVGAVLGAGPVATMAPSAEAANATRNASLPTIQFMYNWQGPWNDAAGKLVSEALRNLESKVGARIVPLINGCCGGGASYLVPQILAGSGPDVYTGCCEDFAGFVSQGMLLNLAPYIKRDNISASVWSSGQYAGFTLPSGQYALPVYAGPHILMYNQTALDELGLEYPADTWDYTEAAKLWRALSGTFNGQQRVGAQLSWFNGFWEGPYLLKGWGGEEMNASHTRCIADSPASTAALTWLYDQIDAGVVGTRDLSISPWPLGPQTVFVTLWGGTITSTASALRTSGGKYRYIPYPKWPVRHASDMNIDFYGINGFTKHPEEAWRLLTQISGPGTYYQRAVQMRLALTPPCLNSLWEEFLSIAYTVAPPLRGTNLEAMMQTALNGWGYTQQYYEYQPVQADAILGGYLPKIAAKAISPAEAMKQAAKQVNALEVTAEATAGSAAKALAREESFIANAKSSATPLTTPPPPLVDAGTAPAKTPSALKANAAAGSYTLSGTTAGAGNPGLHGGSTAALFAGSQWRSSRGTFTCRLTSIVAPKGVAFAGAKFGLMAVSSLGSGAATVYVVITVGNGSGYPKFPGIHFGYRGVANGGNLLDRHVASDTVGAGLLPDSAFEVGTANGTGANVLKRPVWLRLQLGDVTWTAATSLDGNSWATAGSPTAVIGMGWWVGLVVAAPHAANPIAATFDHVSGLVPTTEVVRIGPLSAA